MKDCNFARTNICSILAGLRTIRRWCRQQPKTVESILMFLYLHLAFSFSSPPGQQSVGLYLASCDPVDRFHHFKQTFTRVLSSNPAPCHFFWALFLRTVVILLSFIFDQNEMISSSIFDRNVIWNETGKKLIWNTNQTSRRKVCRLLRVARHLQ